MWFRNNQLNANSNTNNAESTISEMTASKKPQHTDAASTTTTKYHYNHRQRQQQKQQRQQQCTKDTSPRHT